MDQHDAVRLWWAGLDDRVRDLVLAHRSSPLPPEIVNSLSTSEVLRRSGVVRIEGRSWSQTRAGYHFYLPTPVQQFLDVLPPSEQAPGPD